MTARHPHAKLPGKEELERLYVGGMSYQQLADRFGVRKKTVFNTMKLRAVKAGTQWPLKQGTQLYEQRRARVYGEQRWDSITAVMIRAELHEARDSLGVELKEIAAISGVHEHTVYQVSSGVRQRIARSTAEKIMSAIEALEVRERRREGGRRAWETRQRAG